MAVTVNPAALYAFKEHQIKITEEIDAAKKYSDTNLQDMSWTSAGIAGQFLWSTAISGIKNIHQGVDTNLTLLHSLTTVSANEVGKAGDMYAHTDQYHAQQIDNKYNGTPEWTGHGLHRFSAEDPASKLQPPKAEEIIPGGVDKALGAGSWLSLSHWVLEAIDQVCGVNPGKWVLEKFTGDWEAFGKVADSLRKIGEFYNSYGQNISEDMVFMLDSWTGKAAGSAKGYFEKFASSVQHQQDSLEKVAH
ncbi:hypothetical protein Srot_0502 [Segniliparus rotundus DSM 44985]|uniref:Uncharacterized protein n=1 Tax=Segniliparus rotundus (strain ATCC BAA-972 / CDC 1076 / CIP 108378 / DSM 44985 / JCM 13578) TaxID=640132 RepID=D6ZC10_SEGRD|nr:hypothetical protein [Segniliparus rotundus]ADG96987.1 hypothetical protein Srot_0502 [Segniliparus rotundus DSM 44985]